MSRKKRDIPTYSYRDDTGKCRKLPQQALVWYKQQETQL